MAAPFLSLQVVNELTSLVADNKALVVIPASSTNVGEGSMQLGVVDLTTYSTFINQALAARVTTLEATASKGYFPTPITLAMTGPVTSSVTFDGTQNVSYTSSIANGALSMAMVNGLVTELDAFNTDITTLQNQIVTYLPLAGGTVTGLTTFTGGITMSSDILPDTTNTRSLGSPTLMWKDIYVGPGSLYVNGQEVISSTASQIIISADPNQDIVVQTQGNANLELKSAADLVLWSSTTGNILLKNNMVVQATMKVLSSDGNPIVFGDSLTFTTGDGITGGLLIDGYQAWNAGNFNPANYVTVTGNAATATTATALATTTTFSLTGAATAAGVTFNGTQNVALAVTSIDLTKGTGLLTVAQGGTGMASITGLVKGNGAAIMSAAVAGTDYVAPNTAASLTSLTLAADPTSALQATTKQYVDNLVQGLSPKDSVAAASNVNVPLNGLAAIDGYTPVAGDRILVMGQSITTDNGIYIASASTWTRAADANTWNELVGAYCMVQYGTTFKSTGWTCSVPTAGTLGTTPVTWTQFSGAGTVTAGAGISVSGTQVSLTPSGVTAGTYAKTTVDSYGRVTAGSALAAGDIPALPASIITSGSLPVSYGGTGATTLTGMLKGNGTGAITAAVAGTDYLSPASSLAWGKLTGTPLLVFGANNLVNPDASVTAAYWTQSGSTIGYTINTNGSTNFPSDGGITWSFPWPGTTSSAWGRAFDLWKGIATGGYLYYRGYNETNGLPGAWVKLWNSGNQGAGSGLDADTLDGQQGTYYTSAVNLTGTLTVPQGGTGVATLTGLVKGNGTAAMSAAVPGTDYVIPAGSITGNAGSAAKLAAPVTIALSGSVTGSIPFDGSAGVTIPTTLTNSGVAAGTYGTATSTSVITVGTDGRVTAASTAPIPFPSGYNVLPDGGRLCGVTDPSVIAPITPGAVFSAPYFTSGGLLNGGTAASGGAFYHDNFTNGGAGLSLNSDVQALLAAMGRTGNNARYGSEFYIATITAGSGTGYPFTVGATTYYLLRGFNNPPIPPQGASACCWIRLVSGSALLSAGYVGGASISNYALTSTWVFHQAVTSQPTGYSTNFYQLYATPGSVVEIALPAILYGTTIIAPYTAPIPPLSGVGFGSGTANLVALNDGRVSAGLQPTGLVTAGLNPLDNLIDGTVYARVKASALLNGIPLWSQISGAPSSLPPSGAAGGDLGGTYPNPSVLKINGVAPGNIVSHNAADFLPNAATSIPGSADLNTYTTSGIYYQTGNANAASGTNYPVGIAGLLEVYTLEGETYQRYQVLSGQSNANRIYVRGLYSGTWSAWQYLWDSTTFNPTTGAGASGTWSISTTGNAGTASKLATPVTLALTGGATGTATSFDGSSSISIPVTALAASVVVGTLGVVQGGTGTTSLTGIVKGNGTGAFTAAVAGTDYMLPSSSISGNAGSASVLQVPDTRNAYPAPWASGYSQRVAYDFKATPILIRSGEASPPSGGYAATQTFSGWSDPSGGPSHEFAYASNGVFHRTSLSRVGAYSAWATGTAYAANATIVPSTPNGYYYAATTAGTSSTTEPTWPTTQGATVADGSVVWTAYWYWSDWSQVLETRSPLANGAGISWGGGAYLNTGPGGGTISIGSTNAAANLFSISTSAGNSVTNWAPTSATAATINHVGAISVTGTIGTSGLISTSGGLSSSNGIYSVGSAMAPTTQGTYLQWNRSGGGGETDFVNNPGSGSGGFNWYNTNPAGTTVTQIMSLGASGILQVNGATVNGTLYATGAGHTFASTSAEVDLFFNYNNSVANRIYFANGTGGFGLCYTNASGGYVGSAFIVNNQTGAVQFNTPVTMYGWETQFISGDTRDTFLNIVNTSSNHAWAIGTAGSSPPAGTVSGDFFIYDNSGGGNRVRIDTAGKIQTYGVIDINTSGSTGATGQGGASINTGYGLLLARGTSGVNYWDSASSSNSVYQALAINAANINLNSSGSAHQFSGANYTCPGNILSSGNIGANGGGCYLDGTAQWKGIFPANFISTLTSSTTANPGYAGAGNGDGASFTTNNMMIGSWQGIGFGPTIAGQPVAIGTYSHYMNVRTGGMGIQGTFESTAQQSFFGGRSGEGDLYLGNNDYYRYGSSAGVGLYSSSAGMAYNWTISSRTFTVYGTSNTQSDARVKKAFKRMVARPLWRDLEMLSWKWRINDQQGYGPRAQDVEKVAPEYVTEDKGSPVCASLGASKEKIERAKKRIAAGKERGQLAVDKTNLALEMAMAAGKLADKLEARIQELEAELKALKAPKKRRKSSPRRSS